MQIDKRKFRELFSTDLWLMENMLALPCNPPSEVTVDEDGNRIFRALVKVSMGDQQEAVRNYRNNLIPAIFIVTQKVYSELFRVLLNDNLLSTGDKQSDIERKLKDKLGSLNNYSVFGNLETFNQWWDGKYNFSKLRKARNQVVHNQYHFDGIKLVVEKNGIVLLDWTTCNVIKFTEEVIAISKF